MITAAHHKPVVSLCLSCLNCNTAHHTLIHQLCCGLSCMCPDCRQRRRTWWSCVSKICLWGVCPRSPVSAPARWFFAVKDCWSSVSLSCRASTSVFLTSTQSCRMETSVSPGTGRAEMDGCSPKLQKTQAQVFGRNIFRSEMLVKPQIGMFHRIVCPMSGGHSRFYVC